MYIGNKKMSMFQLNIKKDKIFELWSMKIIKELYLIDNSISLLASHSMLRKIILILLDFCQEVKLQN